MLEMDYIHPRLTLVVPVMLLLPQPLLPSQFPFLFFLLVAHVVTHDLPVHIRLGHLVQLALALAREHSLLCLAEVRTGVLFLEEVIRGSGGVISCNILFSNLSFSILYSSNT